MAKNNYVLLYVLTLNTKAYAMKDKSDNRIKIFYKKKLNYGLKSKHYILKFSKKTKDY